MTKIRALLTVLFVLVLTAGLLPARQFVQAQPVRDENTPAGSLTLANWGYEDVTLSGPYSFTNYSLGLPSHWIMQPGGSLDLKVNYASGGQYGASKAGKAGEGAGIPQATLMVGLNGSVIYSATLSTLGVQTVHVPLPDVWPDREEENDRLQITFRVHAPCEDAVYGSAIIAKESSLDLVYQEGPLTLDLANYPQPIFQRTFQPSVVDLLLPKDTTQPQLAAGMAISAGLGSLTNNRQAIHTQTESGWAAAGAKTEHIIALGTPDQNAFIADMLKQKDFPVQLADRRLKLVTTGPDLVIPGKPARYTIQVENSESAPLAGLTLTTRLPGLAASVTCDSGCQTAPGQISWKIASLAPAKPAAFKVTFTLPAGSPLGSLSVTSELGLKEQPVNVSTLRSSIQAEGAPKDAQSQPVGASFFIVNNQAAAETDGVIALAASPWQPGKAVMLVSGLNDAAVNKAALALGGATRFPGLSGQVAVVEEVNPSADEAAALTTDMTLAALGNKDQMVTGVGRKNIYYTFDLPLSWSLTEDAAVTLYFSHSPLLNPERSSITLLLNDQPISASVLDANNVEKGTLTALLPPKSSKPGRLNTLLVQIEADLDDLCIDPETTQSWVSISADSFLHLAHTMVDRQGEIDLSFLPQPLVENSGLKTLLVALPDQPSAAELSLASQLASFLGASSGGNTFQPAVMTGKPPAGFDLSPYHVLVVGRPSRSPLLQAVNASLPQPFVPGSDAILQKIDPLVVKLPSGLDLGYLEILPSPWNAERVLVAVTGISDQGLQDAVNMLTGPDRWQLGGNLSLVRGVKVFTTNTNELTRSGPAAFTATAVAEPTLAAKPTKAAEPSTNPTAIAGDAAENPAATMTNAERYPYLLPAVVGGCLVILACFGLLVVRKPRRK